MGTFFKTQEQAIADRAWHVVDADEQVVGRVATRIAHLLRGKHKVDYAPHTDCGDFVVVVNAEKIKFSGGKEQDKKYYRHSGYIGGISDETVEKLRERRPEEIIRRAVKGMLPKGNLGHQQLSKLKVYIGSEHPHEAQVPSPVEL